MVTTITANDLKKEDALETINPKIDPILQTGQGIIDNALNGLTSQQKEVDLLRTGQEERIKKIGEGSEQLLGKAGFQAQQRELAGVTKEREQFDRFSQDLNTITANISGLSREASAIPLQIQQEFAGTGATDIGVAPIQTGRLRENAIKALTQASLADITVANINNSVIRYNSAVDKAQQAVDLKYQPIEDEIANLKEQLELNRDFIVTPAEKRLADSQTKILDERTRILTEQKAEAKENAKLKQDYIGFALEAGQNKLVSSIANLDPTSETFAEDLGRLQSQIRNPNIGLDIAIKNQQLSNLRKEASLLGEPTASEKKAQAEALKQAKASIPLMQDKIDTVDILKEHSGLNSRVGSTFAGRKPTTFAGGVIRAIVPAFGTASLIGAGLDKASGAGQDFAGGVHKLVGGLTLQELIEAKARGATFGALSNEELNVLATSATTINDWEKKDKNGKGLGVWDIDEASFKRELDNIKKLTIRAKYLAGESLYSPEEQALLDNTFSDDNQALNPANYY